MGIPTSTEGRRQVVPRVATLVAALAGMLTAVALAAPAASAAQPDGGQPHPERGPAAVALFAVQEVGRSHPTSGSFIDDHMTLVKYYNSDGQYRFCVTNYHHTGEVTYFLGYVDWSDGVTTYLPLPGGGATNCSSWRWAHGHEHVEYVWAGAYWIGDL